MKKLTAFLACAAALLLPSCVQWSIGENIREAATWRFAVDVTHRYRCEEDKTQTIIVPEVRFHDSHRVVDLAFPDGTSCHTYGYEYTGRYRRITESRNEYGRYEFDVGELYDVSGKTLSRLPDIKGKYAPYSYQPDTRVASAGDRTLVAAVDGQDATVSSECLIGGSKRRRYLTPRGLDLHEDGVREPTVEKSGAYWLAATAAAPFDYVIDPALTIASTPFGLVYILLFLM